MTLFSKLLGTDVSTDTILFARFAMSFIVILPWIFKHHKTAFTFSQPLKIFLRSLLTLMGSACFFYSLKDISSTNALLLMNTYPLFIPLFLLALHKIHTPHKVWIGILIGFAGITLVLTPKALFSNAAFLLALSSGVLFAGSIIAMRFLSKSAPLLQILCYNFLIGTLASAVLLPWGWKSPSLQNCLFLLGVGVFGAIAYFISAIAYAKAPVRITAPISFLSIVLGMFADWWLWGITPDLLNSTGIFCVILGGILTIYFGQKEIMIK
jgi:drug/metabolite transporter (DMT)-like permease